MRNVINVEEIEKFITRITNNIRNEKISNWFKTTGRKYLIKEFPYGYSLRVKGRTADSISLDEYIKIEYINDFSGDKSVRSEQLSFFPSWAQVSLLSGAFMFKVSLSSQLEGRMFQINDYLHSLTDKPEINRLNRVSFVQAEEASIKWHEKLKRKEKEDPYNDVGTEDIMVFDDGFKIVNITTKESLAREGNLMRHCVGSYWDRVLSEELDILSLRDPKNNPHVTMEISGQNINQIKGKANHIVIPEYSKYIRKFVLDMGYNITRDGDNIGLIRYNGKYYEDINDLIRHRPNIFDDYKFNDENNWFSIIINGGYTFDRDIIEKYKNTEVKIMVDSYIDVYGHQVPIYEIRIPFMKMILAKKRLISSDFSYDEIVTDTIEKIKQNPDGFYRIGPHNIRMDSRIAYGMDHRYYRKKNEFVCPQNFSQVISSSNIYVIPFKQERVSYLISLMKKYKTSCNRNNHSLMVRDKWDETWNEVKSMIHGEDLESSSYYRVKKLDHRFYYL